MSLLHSENRIIPAPVLSTDHPHHVYEAGIKNGVSYRVVQLDIADTDAILDLYAAEKNNIKNQGKHYLLDRNRADIERMFKNGKVIGVIVGDEGRLAAIGAATCVHDEGDSNPDKKNDQGRGRPYVAADGSCSVQQQVYLKSALVHPDWQKGDMGLMGLMYPHRLAEASKMEGRQCLLMKSNNEAVKKAYLKNGWEIVDSFPLPEDPTQKLDTFKMSVAEAVTYLKTDRPDVYQQHALDIFKAHGQTITHDVPAPKKPDDHDTRLLNVLVSLD